MDSIKKNLDNITNNNVNYIFLSFIIVFLIFFSFFIWIFNKLNIRDGDNCKQYNEHAKKYKNEVKSIDGIPSIKKNHRKDIFKNFYYLTAYNCCSGRNYKNNWVDVCALTNALKMGARCLDFEIYSLNNEAIISSSTVDDYTVKETYNSVPFNVAMQTIKTDIDITRPDQYNLPLILLLRIKSNNQKIFDDMGNILKNLFYDPDNSKLLSYSYNYTLINDGNAILYNEQLKVLGKKIIIAVYTDFKSFDKTNLAYLTNIKVENEDVVNSHSILYRYDKLTSKDSRDPQLINNAKKKIIFVLPSLNNSIKNMDSKPAILNGCQCIAMKLQFDDPELKAYYEYFKILNSNRQNIPYALKPNSLRRDMPQGSGQIEKLKMHPAKVIDFFK